MLISGFIGLKGILHNIILIIPVILPLTGSPHVTLINVIQTLKITSLFVHYQGSMVDQKSLLPTWKNINCTHSASPYGSETQGRVRCRSGEKALKNFHHTYFFSQPNRLSSGMPTPHFVYHTKILMHPITYSVTLSCSEFPWGGCVMVPCNKGSKYEKVLHFFLRSSPFLI